jgi:hypothetical protein
MYWIMVLCLVTGLTMGCSTKYVWYNPEKDILQKKLDLYQCEDEAVKYSLELGKAGKSSLVKKRLHECMELRGYAWMPEGKVPKKLVAAGTPASPPRTHCNVNFDPTRVAVVDNDPVTGNILVRGNMPMINSVNGQCIDADKLKIAYEELNQALKSKVGGGFDLRNHTLIDITLIDNQSDLDQFDPELRSFGGTPVDLCREAQCADPCWPPSMVCKSWTWGKFWGNGQITTANGPAPGNMVWWPLTACDASDISQCDKGLLVEENNGVKGWNFSGLVDSVLKEMKSADKGKKVIFFHCIQGCDRTGALAIGYRLKKAQQAGLPLTLREARDMGVKEVNLTPNFGYYQLAAFYCQSLFGKDSPACKP